MNKDHSIARKDEVKTVQLFPAVTRRTVQNGFIVKGKVEFTKLVNDREESFVVSEGDGYIFESNQQHSAVSLEYRELVESFTPMREDYVDE